MQNDVHLQDFIQNKRKRVWKKKDMVSIRSYWTIKL
jgi:hypothetical protein